MSVLVVGGGITGLVAARSLARDGVKVVLAEAGPRLGGKVSTEHAEGFTVEHGPDSFLATRPAGTALVRELGLGDELVGTAGTRTVYIRHRGRLVPMPEGLPRPADAVRAVRADPSLLVAREAAHGEGPGGAAVDGA